MWEDFIACMELISGLLEDLFMQEPMFFLTIVGFGIIIALLIVFA